MAQFDNSTYVDLYAYYQVWPGDLLITDNNAINESIRNILTVSTGTVIFNRSFGCDLIKLIHEPMNTETAQKIKMFAISTIDRYEPRVETIPMLCGVTPVYEAHLYDLKLGYSIKLDKKVGTFSFKLQGAR